MLRCPHCNFLSDPKTGNIFDARFPCPKCGKKTQGKAPVPVNLRAARCSYNPKTLNGFGETTKSAKAVSVLKSLGYGAGFYFAFTKLNEIDDAEDSRNRKLKNMLGPVLPALKTANYLVPALAIPEVAALVTGNSRPFVYLGLHVAIILGMLKILSSPFSKALEPEYAV